MMINLHIKSGKNECQTITSPFENLEITVEQGAVCNLTLATPSNNKQVINAKLEESAKLYLTTIDIDCGNLVRRTKIELNGTHCECYLQGMFIARGEERLENYTSIAHNVPMCHSEQKFHGIVTDKATALFNGLIYVAPHAQQTVALQENHNICLSDSAKILTQPQLEIYADDVKCNHGATVGRRNEQAIFYMRQRGLSQNEAQALLLESFALAPLTDLVNEAIKEKISKAIQSL